MIKKVNFSQNVLQSFSEILGDLKVACYPDLEKMKPIIQIHDPVDYVCSNHGNYTVKELNQMVQTNQILPEHIRTIKINKEVWFSTKEDPFDFYSEKNFVMLSFRPQRLMDPHALEDKSVINSVKKMLARISQGEKSEQELSKVFSEDVCRKVYKLSSSREYILSNLKDAIERTRRHLVQHLRNYHESDIQQMPEFQAFVAAHPNKANPLNEFLKENGRVFSLAEEWGYIKNSQKLIEFQEKRHTPRHVSKYMRDPFESQQDLNEMSQEDMITWIYHMGYPDQNPQELFDEFQKALFFVAPKKSNAEVPYEDAVCSTWAQQDLDQLKHILSSFSYGDQLQKFLQNTFPNEVTTEMATIEKIDKSQTIEPVTRFSSFYVWKKGVAQSIDAEKQSDGSLLFKEEDFHKWMRIGNTSAHANEGFQECARILTEDSLVLSDFVRKLKESSDRKHMEQTMGYYTKKQTIQQSH